MREVATTATAVIPTRVRFAQAWERGWVAATEHGAAVVFDATLAVVATIDAGGPVEAVSLADALIVADRQALRASDPRTGALRWRIAGEHLACRHAGAWLWTAERRASGALVAVARDPASSAVIREVALDDPFGGSEVMLFAHPEPGGFIRRVFGAAWGTGEDVTRLDVLRACGADTVVRDGPVTDAAVLAIAETQKDALYTNTTEAVAQGVFGAPAFVVSGEGRGPWLFWGQDRMDMVEAALTGWIPPA